MTLPVIDEAIKKAAVAWVAVADEPAYGLWCLPLDGALHLVCGPGEQDAPGLAEASEATVSLRGDHGGRIVTWVAAVERLARDSELFAHIAPQVAAKRLNAPGSAEALMSRWRKNNCAVVRLTPVPDRARAGADLSDAADAAPPRDSPARVPVRRPFRLHRVRRSG